MAKYTNISDAQFPENLIDLVEYKDAGDASETIKNQLVYLKALQMDGDYASAKEYLANNSELKKYIFTAESTNRIVEELRNTQIYAKSVSQQIYYQEEKPMEYFSAGDVWISDSEL